MNRLEKMEDERFLNEGVEEEINDVEGSLLDMILQNNPFKDKIVRSSQLGID